MTVLEWEVFCNFRNQYKKLCNDWENQFGNELKILQKQAAASDTPEYSIEHTVVYNKSLDEITAQSEIKLIVIGDNPGKDEQLDKNQKYLVGQAGKLGDSFFKNNPELKIDFRKNVIILNKTPVHTAKTKHLKYLLTNGSFGVKKLIKESQLWMARKTAELVSKLPNVSLWIVGYSELKDKGLFLGYRNELKRSLVELPNGCYERLLVFQHFSMNRFSIDLKEYKSKNPLLTTDSLLKELGNFHKREIFK